MVSVLSELVDDMAGIVARHSPVKPALYNRLDKSR